MKHKFVSTTLLLSLIIFAATIQSSYAVSWSPDMRLTWGNTFNFSPSITQSGDGRIWVVWHSYRTRNYEILYKTYNESLVHPWSPDTQLTSNPNKDCYPSITQAADGTLWVVWSSNRTGYDEIWCKTSSDNGTTWSPDTQFTDDWKTALCPSITQAADGTLWVVWSSNTLGPFNIWFKTSSDNGTTWSSAMFIRYHVIDDKNPSIAGMSDGKMWVVWVRNNTDLFYRVYDGSVWEEEKQLTFTPYPILDLNPSITQLSNGEIWIVWDSHNVSAVSPEPNADTDLYYRNSSDNGTHWDPPTRLTTNIADDDTPSILQTMDGTIWLAWASDRLNEFDIYYRVDSELDPHDVAVSSVTHNPDITNIYWDTNITIEVVPQNQGTEDENVTVQCYVNSDLIGSQGPFNLAPGQLKLLIFAWDTTGFAKDNYIISANVTQVPDETDTLDNTYTDGTIIVTIPGDVNGDGTVDIFDIGTISAHWYPGPPIGSLGYDLNVDINNDGNVNISDIEITSAYWGQSW